MSKTPKVITPRLWLTQLRKDAGYPSTDALAAALIMDITPQALWLIEAGQRIPGLELGFALADKLGFDARRFLEKAS